MIENDVVMRADRPYRKGREYVSPSTYGGRRPERHRGYHRSRKLLPGMSVGPGKRETLAAKIRAEVAKEEPGWSAVLLLLALCMLVANVAFAALGWPLA